MIVKQGSLENPSGSVLIYSVLENMIEESEVTHSLYATVDSKRFLKRFPDAREEVEEALQRTRMFKILANQFSEMISEVSGGKIEMNSLNLFGRIIDDQNIENFVFPDEDLIMTGKFLNPDAAMNSVRLTTELYLQYYIDKLQREHDQPRKPVKKSSLTTQEIQTKPYSEFEGHDIKKYILDKYILPMFRARKTRDVLGEAQLKRDFMDFSQNTRFSSYTKELCDVLSDSNLRITPNSKLITAYVSAICALHLEQYEEAQNQKKVIDRLKRG